MDHTDPLPLAQALLRCASVTPEDAGAQDVLAAHLEALGFTVTRLRFGAIENLFARVGDAAPHFCFAGHTDVVPPGDGWRHDPFGGVVEDGILYGRGACDMKGAIAAFAAAAARHLGAGAPRGSISLLITGDEEGEAVDGTVRVLEWMKAHGQVPDACLVGEPTNPAMLGDMVKVGRRGSLNARIEVRGVQGHVAYPHRAVDPVHPLIAALAELAAHSLNEETASHVFFEPSRLQITSVDVGNPAANIIPAVARARLNIRFDGRQKSSRLAAWVREVVARHCADATVETSTTGEAFVDMSGLGGRVAEIVHQVTGRRPSLDTRGGTSDARFITDFTKVAEFGLVGATMHQTDESVAVADLHTLADIYAAILQDFLP